MHPLDEYALSLTRRHFFGKSACALGTAALASLMGTGAEAHQEKITGTPSRAGGLPGIPHFAPKAKRVIYLFQSGGPSQIELFDPKPLLKDKHGSELPDSIRMGQRLTGMTSGQKSFPVIASRFPFARQGK